MGGEGSEGDGKGRMIGDVVGKRKDERGREAKGICHCCILKPNPPQLSEIYVPHTPSSICINNSIYKMYILYTTYILCNVKHSVG
jgi:hypothetical protein